MGQIKRSQCRGGRPRYDVHTRDFWYNENGEDGKFRGRQLSRVMPRRFNVVKTTLDQAFTLAGIASKGCCYGSTGPAHAEHSKDDQA